MNNEELREFNKKRKIYQIAWVIPVIWKKA